MGYYETWKMKEAFGELMPEQYANTNISTKIPKITPEGLIKLLDIAIMSENDFLNYLEDSGEGEE